jgi:hypothetical protein
VAQEDLVTRQVIEEKDKIIDALNARVRLLDTYQIMITYTTPGSTIWVADGRVHGTNGADGEASSRKEWGIGASVRRAQRRAPE